MQHIQQVQGIGVGGVNVNWTACSIDDRRQCQTARPQKQFSADISSIFARLGK